MRKGTCWSNVNDVFVSLGIAAVLSSPGSSAHPAQGLFSILIRGEAVGAALQVGTADGRLKDQR